MMLRKWLRLGTEGFDSEVAAIVALVKATPTIVRCVAFSGMRQVGCLTNSLLHQHGEVRINLQDLKLPSR